MCLNLITNFVLHQVRKKNMNEYYDGKRLQRRKKNLICEDCVKAEKKTKNLRETIERYGHKNEFFVSVCLFKM